MGMNRALLDALVGHERVKPKRNKFSYKVYYVVFPIHELARLSSRFFSINRFNVWSLHEKDHGARDGSSWEPWIRTILKNEGLDIVANGDIELMTLPRLLGYGFNPISFWFCLDKEGELRAVLCEVNNTFGNNHNYLVARSDGSPITREEAMTTAKAMFVSPFNKVEGEYKFRFNYTKERIEVWIEYLTEGTLKISTYVGGNRLELNDASLVSMFIKRPLMTFMVVFRIHWQALRLWFKGVKTAPIPKHESGLVTRAQD